MALEMRRVQEALGENYSLVREVGRGGMAVVFLAQDLKNERPVALKVLNPTSNVDEAPPRFLREIHVTAGLVHPHILPLLSSDSVDGIHYYVMPYVDGESLRDRLAREGRLPLEDTIHIASEVADALAHAHKRNLVHRDIKPGNILLGSDHVFLADFGIVCSSDPTAPTLTQQGRSLGTPHYQSPEQWKGEQSPDGRSDLYSLACVVFEMLTGEPPFRGSSTESVAGKHIHEKAPPISLLRPSIPSAVDRVIARALAKDPADRFSTTAEFARSLRAAAGTGWPEERRRRWVPLTAVLGGLALVVAAILFLGPDLGTLVGSEAIPDTTRFAVFADVSAGGSGTEPEIVNRLNSALERWEGITVVETFHPETGDRSSSDGQSPSAQLAMQARAAGAGRMVLVTVGSVGENLRVKAELLDAVGTGHILGSKRVLLPPDLMGTDSAFAWLADHLVFRETSSTEAPAVGTTRNVASGRAFLQGWETLEQGDLLAADSFFFLSTVEDPGNARAHLWIALSRAWRRLETPHWLASAEQAAGSRALSPQDHLMASAILAQANGDYPQACPIWEGLVRDRPADFKPWLGLAACREADGLVVRDDGSPSGWSFRTSYQSAVQAYQRAFQLFPPVLVSFREGAFSELRHIFQTRASQRRGGRSNDPGGPRFLATTAWRGDSLSAIPYPQGSLPSGSEAPAQAREEAVRRQRSLLRDLTLGWQSTSPTDPRAYEALAISLSMLEDPSSLDQIAKAREIEEEKGENLRLAGVEAWLRLAFAVPITVEEIRRTKTLADSVLAGRNGSVRGRDGLFLASLAALTGRADQAAMWMRAPGVSEEMEAPNLLRDTGPSLLLYAALGGPIDTLQSLEARVSTDIQESLLPQVRVPAQRSWLARPATLAFFHYPMASVRSLPRGTDFILDYQASFTNHDTLSVRLGFRRLRTAREGLLPGSVTIDALLTETELLVLLGEIDQAEDWLDPSLRALPQNVSWIMTDPVRAAALVRAFALRATIASTLNDLDAARSWRRTAQILWSDADPFLQTRMNELDRLFD